MTELDRRLKNVQQADLSESRVNDDFVLWLKTWGQNILLVALTVAALAMAWHWWGQRKERERDAAWGELGGATLPASLKEIAARHRGVRVRVTLPGKHIDSTTVKLASKASWGELLKAGVEIHEYQPTMMHNKMLIVDKRMVSVGSTNFDVRSFRLNDEASLNVYDEAFAARMTEVYEADLAPTVRYTYETWQQRPLKEKLVEKFVLPLKSQL